ncbi:secretory lipase-domain-containing protein [Aspergillus germanicus]
MAFADPLPPSVDPFYTPKNNDWKDKEPGYIIDHRPVELPSLVSDNNTENPLTAHQLLFVTRNASNLPATSLTTVIRPQYADPDRLVSYQVAYDAPDVNCSPSFGVQRGSQGNARLWNQIQMAFILPYLLSNEQPVGKRPFLNIPDYEGNNAAFTVGPQSGYHTLDSIRAALNSHNYTSINPGARTVLFGYSGGGIASEWASELHASHAPGLKIAGAAIGGPPPNITKTFIQVNGAGAQLGIWVILGMMNAFPELDNFIRHDIQTQYSSSFLGPLTVCSNPKPKPPMIRPKANVTTWFKSGDEFLFRFKHILDENGVMGRLINQTHKPNFPLYIYQGTSDNLTAPIGDTDQLVSEYCRAGTEVTYLRYVGRNHGQTVIAGMYPAWKWITARLNGVSDPPPRCSVEDVTKDEAEDDNENKEDDSDVAGGEFGEDLANEALFGEDGSL